jgi:hypothetical protein
LGSISALLLATTLVGAERRGRLTKIGEYDPKAETVEMFAAIEKGDIAVKLIPKDSTESRVLIENKTDRPLNVKLPEAFAGVPVLAQNQGGAGNGNNHSHNNNNNNSGNQGMGGGMGGGGMGGMGGGMFSVPPEKVGKFKVPTVCLDHGKAEPRAAVPYEIKPIESYTSKPGVRELCQMLGSGQVNQRAAQAAAWHLNNGMSWDTLAAKRLRYAGGSSKPYFTPAEIQTAMQIASSAVSAAKEKEKDKAKEKPARSATSASSASGGSK